MDVGYGFLKAACKLNVLQARFRAQGIPSVHCSGVGFQWMDSQ